MGNEFLEAALEYRFKYNWSIIPLSPNSKIPPKGFEVMPYRDKLPTKEEIEWWWTENPNYNVGVVTGKLSNLFIVDLDKYKPEYKEEIALEYFSDSIETPCDISPRGGEHLYFKYPKENITILAGLLPGIDYRGECGYCLIPPSTFEGKAGRWAIPPNGKLFADLPPKFLALINNKYNNNIYTEDGSKGKNLGQSVTINLNKGTRDQSLFHIAHTMAKGGARKDDISIVLNIVAKQCNPPFSESEVVTKCHSAIERSERKEMNITKAVADFVSVTNGDFSVTECDRFLNLVTTCDKAASRKAISRLKDKNIIEKVGHKDGIYRRVETDFEFITFDDNDQVVVEHPIKLPLDVGDHVSVYQANIILIAGEFNAGKTTFILNTLKDNIEKQIRYIFSEGSKEELKMRFKTFGLGTNYFTKTKNIEYIRKSSKFHDAIRPDAINIIDYMEFVEGDYTQGAEYLRLINDKLTTGLAIVAIQKKEGAQLPRAGDLVMEKPRLVLGFTKLKNNAEYPQGVCEVLKCKMPKQGKFDGKKLRYEIRNHGSLFHVLNDWGYWKL